LVSQELTSLLAEFGSADPDGLTAIEEYAEASRDEPLLLGPVLDACRTPPFLAERRIVVLRDANRLDATQVREVVTYLEDPLETTVLVLAHGEKAVPAGLKKAVNERQGVVIEASPAPTSRARGAWF